MTKLSFLDKYGNAKPNKRADIMLDHYRDFPSIIDGHKKILVLRIKNEREYNMKSHKDELGTAITESKLSDPTANTAVENVYIEELIEGGGDISELVKGMGYSQKRGFSRQFRILMKMEEEYAILEAQLLLMSSNEKKIFELYSESGHDFQQIADMEGIQYDSARRRIWMIRKKIKEGVVDNMEEKI